MYGGVMQDTRGSFARLQNVPSELQCHETHWDKKKKSLQVVESVHGFWGMLWFGWSASGACQVFQARGRIEEQEPFGRRIYH